MQDINDPGSTDTGGIVHARVFKIEVLAKLLCAIFGENLHVVLGSEVQTAGWTGLYARRFESDGDTVRTESALEHLLCGWIEFRNIKRASTNAVAAADAILLLKIDDAIGVLHDGTVSGAGRETTRIGAVHALIFAHQQRDAAVFALVLVELDQVPEIPRRFRHGLIAIVEGRVGEGVTVPLEASYLAGLAADASRGIDQLADLLCALHAGAGDGPRMTRDLHDLQRCLAHTSLDLFDLHKKALELGRESVRINHRRREAIGDGPSVPRAVFLNSAIALVNGQTNLEDSLTVDRHGLDSLGDKCLRDVEAARACQLYLLATFNPKFVRQLNWNLNERFGNQFDVYRIILRPIVIVLSQSVRGADHVEPFTGRA